MGPTSRSMAWGRLADVLLLGLLVALAFLLGCYEMGDSDIWWHLRGGQWILQHHRVPHLDPFTFGSADRPWVDIHWSYEVILALCYRFGGMAALVVLGALLGSLAFLCCLTARERSWPAVITVLCWLPVLVLLSFRFDPRPEIFSLAYLGCYLAVLWRAPERPRLLWLLPVVQLLWVNVQGTFALGPVVLALFLTAEAAGLVLRPWTGLPGPQSLRRWWLHAAGATLTTGAVCLLNPYFLDGALFPFVLLPKVAQEGNIYKSYIDELMSPRDFVMNSTLRVAGRNWFFLAFYFQMLLLPVSFFYPAVWRTCQEQRLERGRPSGKAPRLPAPASLAWPVSLTAVILFLALRTFTLSRHGLPAWLCSVGDLTPVLLWLGGCVAAYCLRSRPQAAGLAFGLGLFLGIWMPWLDGVCLGIGRGVFADLPPGLSSLLSSPSKALGLCVLALVGLFCVALGLRWKVSLFRLLLAAAFCHLGLQALQNWTRLALVAGAVLSWNFGEWAAEVAAHWPATRERVRAAWGARLGLAALVGLWIVAVVTDRYYVHTGEPRHFAFREEPLEFAHDAVLFAGREGMPDRALVFGLAQTGLYVFHNAPRCKPFMDGRLEMPAEETFRTYTRIEDLLRHQDAHWEQEVLALDNPLLLLEHANNHSAEAAVLTSPRWRCVYYDALASVFLHRETDGRQLPALAVDFADRHFSRAQAPLTPDVPGAAAREEKALCNLALSLPRSSESPWRLSIPLLLCALDRADFALAEDATRPDVWVLLGKCYWKLDPHLQKKPPGPADPWQIERTISWAQATYCFRRALQARPDHAPAWNSLFDSYRSREMADAQLAAGRQWLLHDPRITEADRARVGQLGRSVKDALAQDRQNAIPPAARLGRLSKHFPATAIELVEREFASPEEWPWPLAEQVASMYMHLGQPDEARRVWEQVRSCPSRAARLCRLGSTYWVERRLDAAIEHFQQAQAAEPRLAEAGWALAMLYAQQGDAGQALAACRKALDLSLNDVQRSDMEGLRQLLEPYLSSRSKTDTSVQKSGGR